jgi:hypothetical protein
MRRGEVPDGGGEEFQPRPDSRRIDDLTGSAVGEFERRRSRKGEIGCGFGVVIVTSDNGDAELLVCCMSSSSSRKGCSQSGIWEFSY